MDPVIDSMSNSELIAKIRERRERCFADMVERQLMMIYGIVPFNFRCKPGEVEPPDEPTIIG